MRSLNSLAEAFWHSTIFVSCRSVLVVWIVFVSSSYQNTASASPMRTTHSYPNMAISVNAPPDRNITIFGSQCDTTLDLLPALFSGHCDSLGLVYTTASIFGTLNTNGGSINFQVGSHLVIYTVTDVCGMSGMDTMRINVYDSQAPNAICNSNRTINLNNFGEAIVNAAAFDGGSSDSCGHLFFKVKRSNIPIGYSCFITGNPNNLFSDQIKFCCGDAAASPIQLILRVYDFFPGPGPVSDSFLIGHFSDCVLQVTILDKLPPEITCPPNLTILCGDDLDSVLLIGSPIINDNCSALTLDSTIRQDLNSCGVGTIERIYTVTAENGLQSFCTQIITVNSNNSFDGLDTNQLKWPASITFFSCNPNIDISQSGSPIINEGACDLVIANFKDDVYYFSQGGICSKIIRHWQVINWCVHDPTLRPNPNIPTNGYYRYDQQIVVMDTAGPVITGAVDTIISLATENCLPGFVTLQDIQATDCDSTLGIKYTYEVDLFADGIIDRIGIGQNASGIFPIGHHLIIYEAVDVCNTHSFATQRIVVIDGKKPTANVFYGLSSNLNIMDAGIMVAVKAHLFNNSSSDNCSPSTGLRFSFSSDINDTCRIFDCDDLDKQDLTIFVWDEQGNFSFTETYIIIQDLFGHCPGNLKRITIEGNIKTSRGEFLPKTDIIIETPNETIQTISDEHGNYTFQSIIIPTQFSLTAKNKNNPLKNISTSDIVRIQQYILGIKDFDSVYDLIAADVDQNGRITSRDISTLRNLILGLSSELPSGNSYYFIDSDYQFMDVENPFNELKNIHPIVKKSIQSSEKINLNAIKIGDVSHTQFFGPRLNQEKQYKDIRYYIQQNYLEVTSGFTGTITALQLGFIMNGNCILAPQIQSDVLYKYLQTDFYCITDQKFKCALNFEVPLKITKGDILFKIPLYQGNTCFNISEIPGFVNEIMHDDGAISHMELESGNIRDNNQHQGFVLESWTTNVFTGQISIMVNCEKATAIQLQMLSFDGKIIQNSGFNLLVGINEIQIQKEKIGPPGVYFLHLYSNNNNELIKLMVY
ncbi:MAG: dockerin type I domain-containing protein [Bacteroidota bacterium]|nr:dockerin type I domain-containing protein [Bacteroidota bacterium]